MTENTAFSKCLGLWKFTVMPFVLCNAPAMFKQLMESILGDLTCVACQLSLDDVIIIGRMFQEQLDDMQKVFQRVQKAHLKLKPEECLKQV
jgi:hypothetical protein